jgi:hypothetical protein
MPASNIPSVFLNKNGSVTIKVEVRQIADHDVVLLHVWLAATGDPPVNGAGLAIDCLNPGSTSVDFDGKTDTFTIKNAKAADGARFGEGPATVSAIVVLSPKPGAGAVAEVIQWGRTLKLVTDKKR